MTVTVETPIASSVANGVTTVFPHLFTILDADDLVVVGVSGGVTTTYVNGVDYTVSGVGTSSGSVTFGAAPTSGVIVTRYRDTELSRETDYQQAGDLLAAVVNRDFDRLWQALQDIYNGGKGAPTSLRVPSGESVDPFPDAATRASHYAGFDASGNPTLLLPAAGTAAALASELADPSNVAYGDAKIAVKRTVTGAVATTLHAIIEKRDFYAQEDFGATFDGTTDDTAALTACWNAAYAAGGAMHLAVGTARVTALDFVYSASRSVRIVGRGQGASIIKKTGGTTTPVLKLSASSVLDTYGELRDFTVVGLTKSHHGIQVEKLARFNTHMVGINTCDVGWESLGCLIVNHYAPSWTFNNIGFRCRKSSTIYSNLVQFFGGELRQNTTFALDIGDANGVYFFGPDISNNGTTGNTSTGAVKIRATVDDEIGYATIGFYGAHFESNLGSNFVCDAASGLNLVLAECPILASEGGLAMNVGAISSVSLRNIIAGGGSDVVTLAAARSYVQGGVIATLTDTSTLRTHDHVSTSGGDTGFITNGKAQLLGQFGFGGAAAATRPGGWGAVGGTSTRSAWNTATITLEQLAERVAAIKNDLTTLGIIGT